MASNNLLLDILVGVWSDRLLKVLKHNWNVCVNHTVQHYLSNKMRQPTILEDKRAMRVSVNIQLQICLFESPLGEIIKDQLVKSLKNEQGHTSKFFPLTRSWNHVVHHKE